MWDPMSYYSNILQDNNRNDKNMQKYKSRMRFAS